MPSLPLDSLECCSLQEAHQIQWGNPSSTCLQKYFLLSLLRRLARGLRGPEPTMYFHLSFGY